MNILQEIIANTKIEVDERKKRLPIKELKKQLVVKQRPSFVDALSSDEINIIAEIKKASPSKGVICDDFDPAAIAIEYAIGGAAAISVLTDEKYFQGSLDYLQTISQQVKIPLLRKDFVVDEYMIYEAAAKGASAVLLIAAVLSTQELRTFRECAESLDMSALVEIHNMDDLDKAVSSAAEIIGVNNRNLENFQVSLQTSLDLVENIPSTCIKVSESGIFTYADIATLKKAGFNAFLIGESLMRQADRITALRELRGL